MRYLVLFICLSPLACSRGGFGSKFGLSLPGRDQSSFAAEDTLKKSIMVVHIGGRAPVQHEQSYQPGEIPRGQDLSVDFTNVPIGTSYFVQFLAVYDNTLTGGLKVTYGFAEGTVQHQNDIEITAQNVSLNDTMVRVAGRYLSAPNVGPTGTIVASFYPALGHPPIAFDSFSIQNGWFEIRAPDADELLGTFRFTISGQELFSSLHPQNPQLTSYGPHMLRIKKPLSYHPNNALAVPTPEANLYLGFWGQVSNESICYINVQEIISFEFRDENLMTPLEYKGDSGTAFQVRAVAGGVSQSYASFPGSNCSLRFDHQRVSSALPLDPLIVQ